MPISRQNILFAQQSNGMTCRGIMMKKSPRRSQPNSGPDIIQPGTTSGTVLGGNLCSLDLLNGTDYFPKVAGDIILCIEDDSYDSIPETVERNIQSLMQQPFFRQVKAILIGCFQAESRATDDVIGDIILSKNIAADIPVIANLDFGHTDPKFTYPVGGRCQVASNGGVTITFQ